MRGPWETAVVTRDMIPGNTLRRVRRASLVVVVAAAVAGCGSDDGAASPEDARACLEDAHLRVEGGPRAPGDADAPDTQLLVGGHHSSAFLAFYDDEARAARLAPRIEDLATQPGAVERHGKVTIFWVRGKAGDEAAKIKACVS